MTKPALATIMAFACIHCLGQGTVNFVNISPGLGLDAPVLTCGQTKLPGPDYRAGLLAGPAPTTLSLVAETPLLNGAGAGYFSGGVVTIAGVPGGGTAWLQIIIWDSTLGGTTNDATFAQAQTSGQSVWGQSSLFSVVTGDLGATPPSLPAALLGLSSINVGGSGPHFVGFTLQPTNQAILAGRTATFAVGAISCPAPDYQWYFNGAMIRGATDDHLGVTNVQVVNDGNYWVVLSNAGWGSHASAQATLTVTGLRPTITLQPIHQAVVAVGGSASFGVSALGTPPPGYQWLFNSGGISNATNAVLNLTNIQMGQAGSYTVAVTNDFGAMTSTPAILIVQPLLISSQPQSLAVLSGATANFGVSVFGTQPLAYQWLFNNSPIPGATHPTLQLTNVQLSESGTYLVIVTNAFGAVTSAPALLSVEELRIPSQTVEIGSSVQFTVQVSGGPLLSYTWFQNGTTQVAPASADPTLLLTNVQPAQAGTYSVVVTTLSGPVASAQAVLAVIPPVHRRWVPGLILTGQSGMSLNLETLNALGATQNWTALDSLVLTNGSERYFDLTEPPPLQRFYRAWTAGNPGAFLALDIHMFLALTLTGSIGSTIRIDAINPVGPTDAWFTLATVTLTNTSQIYFDGSTLGQPPRLYRLVPIP